MSTAPEALTDLIGNLSYARSGWGDWAKRVKAAGLPAWPQTFETAGALARMPSYKETVPLSESEVKARMRSLLKRRGDCGWSGLMELILSARARSGVYWLVEKRDQWPAAMAAWPEERVRTMTFALRMDEQLLLPDAVALFETVETRDELTLARWLTGRTWAKGARGRGDGGGAAEPRREPQVHLTAVATSPEGPEHVVDQGLDRGHRR